jgi:hypothetical protein
LAIWWPVGRSSGPVAHMLLRAVNRNKPAFASRRPQFVTRREVRGRIVETAHSHFHLGGAVYQRKHGRTADRAEVTVVRREPPASCLSGHRYFVRWPHRKEIAKRAGLLSTHEAVAKADSEGLSAHLKPHLTAVAAAGSLSHVLRRLRVSEPLLLGPFHQTLPAIHCAFKGGLDDGAMAAFASDSAPPGVAAPLASEPLPFLPAGEPCPLRCRIVWLCPAPGRWIAPVPDLGPGRTMSLQELWRSLASPGALAFPASRYEEHRSRRA